MVASQATVRSLVNHASAPTRPKSARLLRGQCLATVPPRSVGNMKSKTREFRICVVSYLAGAANVLVPLFAPLEYKVRGRYPPSDLKDYATIHHSIQSRSGPHNRANTKLESIADDGSGAGTGLPSCISNWHNFSAQTARNSLASAFAHLAPQTFHRVDGGRTH